MRGDLDQRLDIIRARKEVAMARLAESQREDRIRAACAFGFLAGGLLGLVWVFS